MTPNEYYRSARPDKFSDSIIKREAELTRELMEFEMSRLATNEKHNNFERLCVKLAEKFITPNLIPQVGPAAGGDGKTDSETYPVDNKISNKWYIPKGGAVNGEKWAFAISTMEKWSTKVRRDVKSIIGTGRNYTQIYFMSSQKISSKQQKETQDKLEKEFDTKLTIIDETWIIDKVIEGKLQSVFARTLEMSDTYIKETIIKGPVDIQRESEIEKLEERIADADRYLEFDYQIIEDALEVVLISRYLEKSKSEIVGQFERATRLANEIESHSHLVKIHYYSFNTFLYYFDDVKLALESYSNFIKAYDKVEANIRNLEFKNTLVLMLEIIFDKAIDENKTIDIDIDGEKSKLDKEFNSFIKNKERPTTANIANILYQLRVIKLNFEDHNIINKSLSSINQSFKQTAKYLDFPFDKMVTYITSVGEYLPDSEKYDIIVNTIANIEGDKSGDLRKGERLLDRANQKIEGKNTSKALVFFGNAFKYLVNGQKETSLIRCLMGMAHCYSMLGLYYAAFNSSAMALSHKLGSFYQSRILDPILPKVIEENVKYAIMLGNIPKVLMLLELYDVMVQQLNYPKDKYNSFIRLYDSSIAIRLYNDNYRKGISEYLPELFNRDEFNNSFLMSYYLLNKEDRSKSSKEEWKKFIDYIHNQPIRNLYQSPCLFMEGESSVFSSNIAGCVIKIKSDNTTKLICASECLIAMLETLFATRAPELVPTIDNISYYFSLSQEGFKVTYRNKRKSIIDVTINDKQNLKYQFEELLPRILETFIEDKFVSNKEIETLLKELAEGEDIFSRMSIVNLNERFHNEIFGTNPKNTIWHWIKKDGSSRVELVGNPKQIENFVDKESSVDFKNVLNLRHDQREVLPFLNDNLWDRAERSGMGYAEFIDKRILFLAFEDGDLAREIFIDLVERYGKDQTEKGVRLSFVRGFDKLNPYHYRLVLSPLRTLKSGKIYVIRSRAKTMYPSNHDNFNKIVKLVSEEKNVKVCPATLNSYMEVDIMHDLEIVFGEIKVIDAWRLKDGDPEVIALMPDEEPVVPKGVSNPPYLGLTSRK